MRTLIDAPTITAGSAGSVPGEPRQPLRVHVVATTERGTEAALGKACALSEGFDPEIVLLVPHVVPYHQPLDHPAAPVTFTISRFRALAERVAVPVTVRVCVCRPERSSLEPLLPRDAIILVGGRKGRLWPSRQERVASALTQKGHRVVFVEVSL